MLENSDTDSELRWTVVLDGSNIIWGGSTGVEPITYRLFSAIAYYEELGYTVIPVMSRSQFQVINRKKVAGHEQLQRLRTARKLELSEDDDLLVINLVLEHNAWMITQDTFCDRHDGTKKERTLFPHLPWDDIDALTRGTQKQGNGRITSGHHWSVVGRDFFDPTIPKAPPSYLYSEYDRVNEMASEARHHLDKILSDLNRISLDGDEEVVELMKKKTSKALNMIISLESIIPEPRLPSPDELARLTVPEIKEICRSRDLTVTGTKDELIDRITELKKTKDDHSSITDITDEDPMITESIVPDKEESAEQTTDEESGTFTKQEFIEELFEDVDDRDQQDFATIYAYLIRREPKYHLKKIGIKPGLYIKQCSDFVDIEIRYGNQGQEYYWIRKLD